MKMMNELVWLPPLLFILHDMGEIVWALAWKRGEMGRKRYLQMRFTPFGAADSTGGFSFCVYEELLILTAASLLGRCCGFYGCGLDCWQPIYSIWWFCISWGPHSCTGPMCRGWLRRA